MLYAVMGGLLLLVSRRSDKFLLILAALCATVWAAGLLAVALRSAAQPQEQLALAQVDRVLVNGSFFEAVSARLNFVPFIQSLTATFNGLAVPAFFCAGLVAGRHQIFREPERYKTWWTRGFWLGLLVGLPCAFISSQLLIGNGGAFGVPDSHQAIAMAVNFMTAPILAAGYVSLLALVHLKKPGLLRVFRPAGRMSLTSYIGESVLLATIFCGFGLGFMGQFGAASMALISIGVWLALTVIAHVWQHYFTQGPLEKLLKL